MRCLCVPDRPPKRPAEKIDCFNSLCCGSLGLCDLRDHLLQQLSPHCTLGPLYHTDRGVSLLLCELSEKMV